MLNHDATHPNHQKVKQGCQASENGSQGDCGYAMVVLASLRCYIRLRSSITIYDLLFCLQKSLEKYQMVFASITDENGTVPPEGLNELHDLITKFKQTYKTLAAPRNGEENPLLRQHLEKREGVCQIAHEVLEKLTKLDVPLESVRGGKPKSSIGNHHMTFVKARDAVVYALMELTALIQAQIQVGIEYSERLVHVGFKISGPSKQDFDREFFEDLDKYKLRRSSEKVT